MNAKIGVELLRSKHAKPTAKKFEIWDTELKGFGLIVYPDVSKPDGKVLPGGKIYVARYRLPNGKQTMHRIGRHTLFTPAQARDDAEKILRQVKDGVDPKAKDDSVVDYTLKSFLDEKYKPWVEVNHKNSKATLVHFYLLGTILDMPLNDITGLIVDSWRTDRLKLGINKSTVNRDISAIKSLFSKAVEWEVLSSNPLEKIKPYKLDTNGVVRYLSKDENNRLMLALDAREERIRAERANANDWRKDRGYPLFPDLRTSAFADHLKPLVLISLNTGVRWGELSSLTWDSVDLDRAILTITGGNAKNSKTRHIPLNKTALDTLKGWQKQSTTSLVFPGRDGGLLVNVDRSWSAILAAANIKAFRWHDMRHTFASWLVMAGVDLNTVRELMGHGDLKMTIRYAHLAPEHKAAAVAMLVKS